MIGGERMNRKKLLFIYNPHAGKEILRTKLSSVIECFMAEDYIVTIFATQREGEASHIVKEWGKDFDRVVCSGGDGTLHEVVDGMMRLDQNDRCPCGYIPTGTVCDLATSLLLPKKINEAARVSVKGQPLPYDIGSMNDMFFSYIAAFGAFTSVSYETPQTFKNILGRGAYWLQGILSLPGIKPYHTKIITDEGEQIEDDFVFGMVANSVSVGGFPLFRKSKVLLNDGYFEGLFVKNPKNPIELQAVMNAFMSAKFNKQIVPIRSKSFDITFDREAAFTLDGENGGSFSHVKIDNHYRALTFLTEGEECKE